VGEKFRSGRELITWLQGLKPSEFEDYIAYLFKSLGYSVEVTGGAYDGGIDVIATKNGIKHYIQCKKFITQQVGVGAVRDFYGAMADKGANAKGFFITTNVFTLEAEKFAEGKPLELIDGARLIKYIEMAKTGYVPVESKKFCPLCKSEMVKRKGKFGEFYGCSRYPECKGTQKI
jgi:restriction system protein